MAKCQDARSKHANTMTAVLWIRACMCAHAPGGRYVHITRAVVVSDDVSPRGALATLSSDTRGLELEAHPAAVAMLAGMATVLAGMATVLAGMATVLAGMATVLAGGAGEVAYTNIGPAVKGGTSAGRWTAGDGILS